MLSSRNLLFYRVHMIISTSDAMRSDGTVMLDMEAYFGGNPATALLIVELAVIPAAGVLASIILWRRKLGRVNVQRMLVQDNTKGKPGWKLVASSLGMPVSKCKISIGRKELLWDSVITRELEIGHRGLAFASIPFEVSPKSLVIVKSGCFPIFRREFRNLEEVCMND